MTVGFSVILFASGTFPLSTNQKGREKLHTWALLLEKVSAPNGNGFGMRDGPEGMVVRSRALPVPLDPDQNGKPRSSIVIVPDDDSTVVVPTKQGGRRDTATPLLVEVLRAALDGKGEYFTPDGKLPLQAVDSQHVRELFYRRYVDVEEDEHKSRGAQKQAYKRGVEGAITKKIVNGQKDNQGRQLLWFVRDEGEAL